jgi:DNA-binding Xre family transcriptional regulator
MAELQIKTGQLKAIQLARKIGRPKLAKQVGITERQLAKIEKSE